MDEEKTATPGAPNGSAAVLDQARADAAAEERKCSKCGQDLDTEGYPLFCKSCRAKYQREYQQQRKQLVESRGYSAGITAMKFYLAGRFAALGSGSFTGNEVAHLIMQSKGPDAVR